MKLPLSLFLTTISIAVFPQTVQNVTGVQVEKKAFVTYDLLNGDSILHYVALYYSADGGRTFSSELKRTTGDVGRNIEAGVGRKISWDVEAELGHLQSDVVFKVTAAPVGVKVKAVNKVRVLSLGGSMGGYRAEITSSERVGTELKFVGTILGTTKNERNLVTKACTQITTTKGQTYSPKSGKLGNVGLDEPAYLVRGAAMPLSMTFDVPQDVIEPVDLVVCIGGNISIRVKNIPTQ